MYVGCVTAHETFENFCTLSGKTRNQIIGLNICLNCRFEGFAHSNFIASITPFQKLYVSLVKMPVRHMHKQVFLYSFNKLDIQGVKKKKNALQTNLPLLLIFLDFLIFSAINW